MAPGDRSLTAVNALPPSFAGTVELLRIAPGHTFDELHTHVAEEIHRGDTGDALLGPPDWTETALQVEARYAATEVVSGTLTPGQYGIVCTVPDGVDFRPVKLLGPIDIR